MYELLLRTETLFLGLRPLLLLAIGGPALIAGLVFWLGGVRYSTWIIGLLGALVGAVVGLMISQWLGLHLWASMIVCAALLATASVLLRNILILVLAVVVIAGASGAGYLAVLLDRAAPQEETATETQAEGTRRQSPLFQSLNDTNERLEHVDRLTQEEEANFGRRVEAVGKDTWETAQPHLWKLSLSVVAGAAVAVFLVWIVKNALIALAYSVVGTATLVLGIQTATLAAGWHVVSALPRNPWLLPATFGGMTLVGWIVQLLLSRKPKAKREGKAKTSEPKGDE
jgi:hypothetical protein